MIPDLDQHFPRYTDYDPKVPVWCITPEMGGCIHRFFDTSPVSPSGRYVAVFQLGQETRMPEPGETGQVVLVDLQTGAQKAIFETAGWEPQMGCNLNWGGDDETLFLNDVDTSTWEPFAWKLNPHTGEKQRLQGTVYQASPDGKWLLSASMEKMRRTQKGYGVVIPDERVGENQGFPEDDGLWKTNTETGERVLLASLKTILDQMGEDRMQISDAQAGKAYGFHSKWNPQGTRLIFTIRWVAPDNPATWAAMGRGPLRFNIITMKPDGSDMQVAVPADYWRKGGHHINWYPDGEHLSMNLGHYRDGKAMDLVKARYDGSGIGKIHEIILGSGHPTVHPDGRHILTDTYTFEEPHCFGDGTIPLRWIDLAANTEECLVRVNTKQPVSDDSTLRVDPHPAWDRSWRYVAFNGFIDGTRRVFLADLGERIAG